MNWNKTEHRDYNAVPNVAAATNLGTLRISNTTDIDTTINGAAPGGIWTAEMMNENDYNYEKKAIDI